MNKVITLVILCLIKSALIGQGTYYDVKGMRYNCVTVSGTSFKFNTDTASVSKLAGYLRNYLPDSVKNAQLTQDQVFIQFADNPFFGQQISSIIGGQSATPAGFGGALSSIGNLDVTNFADGLAQFLVERAKEELDVAFFQRFTQELKKYPEFGIFFPNTIKLISNLAGYQISNILPSLQEAFLNDLNSTTQNLLKFGSIDETYCQSGDNACINRVHKYQTFFKGENGQLLLLAIDFADGVRSNKSLKDLVERLKDNPYIDALMKLDPTHASIIKFSTIVTTSLFSKDSTRFFITYKEFSALLSDNVMLQLYLGLLYQSCFNEGVTQVDGVPLSQILPGTLATTDITKAISYISNIRNAADQLTNVKTGANSGALSIVDFTNYVNGITAIIKTSINLAQLNNAIPQGTAAKINGYLNTVTLSSTIVFDISEKKYNTAVTDLVRLLDTVITDNHLFNSKDSAVIGEVLKYGSFIATVANAKNSNDIKDAISNIALPVGSSVIKKNSAFNIAIQSYVGVFAGSERFALNNNSNHCFNSMGATTPVGLGFSFGLVDKKTKASYGSLTIFGSVIDIGAITSFRFSNADTTQLTNNVKIKLTDILAPGGDLVYGIPKVPISLGGGVQYEPSLSSLTANTEQVSAAKRYRWQIFIAVDLPIINVYNKAVK